jgi:hypothetical protein
MALPTAWSESPHNGGNRGFFSAKWGQMGMPVIALNQLRNSRIQPQNAENHFDNII